MISRIKINNFVKDSVLYIISAGISKGALVILIPYLTIYLSVIEFGHYDFALVLIGFLSILFSFGLPQALQMEFFDMENNKDELNKIFSSHFFISLAICVILFLPIYYIDILPITGKNKMYIILLVLFQSCIYFYQTSFLNILRLKKETFFYFKLNVLLTLLQIAFTFAVLIYLPNKLLFLLGSNLITSLIGVFICYKKLGFNINFFSIDWILFVGKCKIGFVLVLSYIAYWVINGADRWIVLKILGEESQGTYSIAARISSVAEPLLITPLLAVLLPMSFGKYMENNYKEDLTKWIFGSLSIFFIMALLSSYILPMVLYKNTPIEVYRIVPYFVLGYGFYFISQFGANLLVFKKKFKTLLFNIIMVASLNVLLNVSLSYYYGLDGAGISFLLTNIVWAAASLYSRSLIVKTLIS